MRKVLTAVLALASVLAVAAPASAEFFGCNDNKKGKVLATYTTGSQPVARAQSYRAGSRVTHEFAAQSSRPRITVYPRSNRPGPNAKRHCRAWLAKEYRVSGTVIVPRQQCWWE
jgi:hypothetical protein